MIEVTMTPRELWHGAMEGVRRFIEDLDSNMTDYVKGGLEPWDLDIEPAISELAVHKALGRYYCFPEYTGSDLENAEIRWTAYADGHLLVRPRDPADTHYVLVTGRAPTYRVIGYIHARDARTDEYRRDPGNRGLPCWMVPQSRLTALVPRSAVAA